MLPTSNAMFPRFASLSGAPAPIAQPRSGLRAFFMAPFYDVDDRVARKIASQRAERAAREAAAMSALAGSRRG
jgi:hypothetical protein